MASYSITRALTRVKTLKDQLNKLGSTDSRNLSEFVGTAVLAQKETKQHQDYIVSSEAKYNQFNDLFNELVKIKNAIKASNAKTEVTIGGKTMTISEVITLKEVVDVKYRLYRELLDRHLISEKQVANAEDQIESKARLMIKDLPKDTDPAVLENTFNMFKESVARDTRLYVATGINMEQVRKEFKSLEEFHEEIDYKLSESNAVTIIEI